MLDEPLSPDDAKRLIRSILRDGNVAYSEHAKDRTAQRQVSTVDIVNVLRGGAVQVATLEKGTWRYPVQTSRFTVVVAFRSESELVVVTAWRTRA